MVEKYKNDQCNLLLKQYEIHVKNLIEQINEIPFKFDVNVFEDFDNLRAISTEKFKILNSKKMKLFEGKKLELRNLILLKIDQDVIEESVFYISFLKLYEEYFGIKVFIPWLEGILERKFDYHFMSDKETNRLDKPEWIFSFISKEVQSYYELFELYTDEEELSVGHSEFRFIFRKCQELISYKIKEMVEFDGN